MINLDNFLEYINYVITEYFASTIGCCYCKLHPGRLDAGQQKKLEDLKKSIFTTLTEVLKTENIPTGEIVNTVKMLSLILVYNDAPVQGDKEARNLVFQMTNLLMDQLWNQRYTKSPQNVKATDLYGLLNSNDQLIGDQGWNPTLQRKAKDLVGTIAEADIKFSLWSVEWEQEVVFEFVSTNKTYFTYPTNITVTQENTIFSSIGFDKDSLDRIEINLNTEGVFVENNKEGDRIVDGLVTLQVSEQTKKIVSYYDLFWVDEEEERVDEQRKITRLNTNGNLKYTFPKHYVLPPKAKGILCIAINPSVGNYRLDKVSSVVGNWKLDPRAPEAVQSFHTSNSNYIIGIGKEKENWTLYTYQSKDNSWKSKKLPDTIATVHGIAENAGDIYVLAEMENGIKSQNLICYENFSPEAASHKIIPVKSPEKINIKAMCCINNKFYVFLRDEDDKCKGFGRGRIRNDQLKMRWFSRKDSDSNFQYIRNISNFFVCHHSNFIVVAGGLKPNGTPRKEVAVYNILQNRWDNMTDLPVNIIDASCLYHQHYLYVFGGKTKEGDHEEYKVTNKVWRYDTIEKSWTALAEMQTARALPNVSEHNGNFYVFGEKGVNGNVLETEIYIP